MTDDNEILPPDHATNTPLAQARYMARNALASAAVAMRAAHQATRDNIDQAFGAMPPLADLPPGAAAEHQAMAATLRQELITQMETRTVQLADVLQRMAFGHIAEAGAAVAKVRNASAKTNGTD